MKTIIKATAIAVTSIVAIMLSANVNAAPVNDAVCLSLGKYAFVTAEAKKEGMTEEGILDIMSPEGKKIPALKLVIEYVYTMDFDAATSRKLVYLGCKAGNYPV